MPGTVPQSETCTMRPALTDLRGSWGRETFINYKHMELYMVTSRARKHRGARRRLGDLVRCGKFKEGVPEELTLPWRSEGCGEVTREVWGTQMVLEWGAFLAEGTAVEQRAEEEESKVL